MNDELQIFQTIARVFGSELHDIQQKSLDPSKCPIEIKPQPPTSMMPKTQNKTIKSAATISSPPTSTSSPPTTTTKNFELFKNKTNQLPEFPIWLYSFFRDLRSNEQTHLGAGSIRLTLEQQFMILARAEQMILELQSLYLPQHLLRTTDLEEEATSDIEVSEEKKD